MWNINSERGGFILLEKFISPVEADIVAGRLQAEGVAVMLLDKYMVWNNLLQSQALGGVKILVKRRDLEIARRILEDVRQGGYSPEPGEQSGGKTEVTYNKWGRILLSTVLQFVMSQQTLCVRWLILCTAFLVQDDGAREDK
ncbi:DUF2007 domain-containing protein [Salmonella enterica]|uniref:DUF2007 domain-containing protein n=1 Tax=Salmonella newport TaxID=108619 RepID=A0A752FEY8_SALNE|nr:DUF2007 domain-containing protein [Salmonella enterica]EKQ9811901.1 DUF2007 domain-containing protein [Salmonella enterica subsp. enterica serovar Newport]ECO9821915.1 DUF2007 domain-containing protein [Salmonella enterica]EGW7195859.1 DUF2007 domain-containing protein [Salmonella enterica]EIW2890282.1 DUF2007 domain-containing protein [Salmonella enterica]